MFALAMLGTLTYVMQGVWKWGDPWARTESLSNVNKRGFDEVISKDGQNDGDHNKEQWSEVEISEA